MTDTPKHTSLILMANLGSEFSKIFYAKENNDAEMLEMAMLKAKSIISELKTLPETKNNAEIDMLTDIIDDISQNGRKYDISPEHLKSYFIPFAMRLMQV